MLLIKIIDLLFQVYMIMLFVRILGSWIPEFNFSKFMRFISFYTDPYLNIFRRVIPPLGMIDISPIFAFICLNLLQSLVITIIGSIFL